MDCPACHQPNVDGARFCAKCGALLPLAATDQQDSLVGQIIGGRYRVTQVLGEGGMGRVYLAEQQMGTNVRKVAVKTLQTQFAKDPQVLARFHRECGTVSELEHPNTIQFFDFGQTPDGELYIAMEYVQEQSLSDALQQGPMRPDRAVRILAQICGSLEEAHGRGVIHRDLKPDNVILTTRAGQADFVKVLDFGIAKRSEAKDQAQEQKLTQQGMVLGTPPYMSPEQFTGKELDPRSDIYSLAIMAYEMLTGRLPFEAETAWQWATQHMTAQPVPFEMMPTSAAIPQAMKQAILRALSKDRIHRHANVRQFYEELSSGGTGVGTVSPALPTIQEGATSAPAPTAVIGRPSTGGHSYSGGSHPGYPGYVSGPHAHMTPAGGQTFPTSPQPQAYGAPPPRSGGGKGLIIALVVLAGLLAIVGVVLVAQRLRPKEEIAATDPTAINPAMPTVVPTAPEKPATQPAADPPGAARPAVAGPGAAGHKVSPSATPAASPAASASSAPSAAPPATSAPSPAPTPTLSGEAACAEARRLAEIDDLAGAARAFAGCSGPGAAGARNAIARRAPDAVKRRIFNGDCAGARALVAALNSIGAGAAASSALESAPQCKK